MILICRLDTTRDCNGAMERWS